MLSDGVEYKYGPPRKGSGYTKKSTGTLNYRHRYRAKMKAQIDELNEMQKGLPTLTQKEWEKAVRHFKTCAMCPSEEINTRMMFIPAKEGGGYNRGNILPVCGKCGNTKSTDHWPSVMLSKQHGDGYYTRDPKAKQRLQEAIDYLKQEASHD